MSKKMLIDYFKNIKNIYQGYPVYTSSIRLYEEGNNTYAFILTDDIILFVLKYNPDLKKDYMNTDEFKLNNDDYIKICYGEISDKDVFCDTVVQAVHDHYEQWRPILNNKGFRMLIKTRKAILNRNGTFYPLGFTQFTRDQQKHAKMMEQADVALACVNCTRDNPIPGAISTMLNVVFDSVSNIYRKAYDFYKRDSKFASFRYAFTEYADMDISSDAMRELYELVNNLLEQFYPFNEAEF